MVGSEYPHRSPRHFRISSFPYPRKLSLSPTPTILSPTTSPARSAGLLGATAVSTGRLATLVLVRITCLVFSEDFFFSKRSRAMLAWKLLFCSALPATAVVGNDEEDEDVVAVYDRVGGPSDDLGTSMYAPVPRKPSWEPLSSYCNSSRVMYFEYGSLRVDTRYLSVCTVPSRVSSPNSSSCVAVLVPPLLLFAESTASIFDWTSLHWW
mmetsp:Transcript_8266/g.17128  ORF Transcript_8266/g.17128 Transcript_8266/m.17128 type:complete len:209 (+) Transcript_8266:129-755(+)